MAKTSTNKTSLRLVGCLAFDPSYRTYTKKTDGSEGAVCNLKIHPDKYTNKGEVFECVTFDKDMAYFIAQNFRRGHKITLTHCWPKPDKDKDGKLKWQWQFNTIEADVSDNDMDGMDGYGDEPYPGDDDLPPI